MLTQTIGIRFFRLKKEIGAAIVDDACISFSQSQAVLVKTGLNAVRMLTDYVQRRILLFARRF